jgi:hypothetical protein
MRTRIHARVTVAEEIDLEVMDCAACGVVYAVTRDYDARRRKDGQGWSCPNGHSNVYGNTEADRLKRELEDTRKGLAATREDLARERSRLETAKRSHAATKGQLTKIQKRVAAGVCPYCHRHFEALARHMTSKHKECPAPEPAP